MIHFTQTAKIPAFEMCYVSGLTRYDGGTAPSKPTCTEQATTNIFDSFPKSLYQHNKKEITLR
jgi:hypothetical protein